MLYCLNMLKVKKKKLVDNKNKWKEKNRKMSNNNKKIKAPYHDFVVFVHIDLTPWQHTELQAFLFAVYVYQ
jgi:hypothetical protein